MLDFDLNGLVSDIKSGKVHKQVLESHVTRYHNYVSRATVKLEEYASAIRAMQQKVDRADAMVADPQITYYERYIDTWNDQYNKWTIDLAAYTAAHADMDASLQQHNQDLQSIQTALIELNTQ